MRKIQKFNYSFESINPDLDALKHTFGTSSYICHRLFYYQKFQFYQHTSNISHNVGSFVTKALSDFTYSHIILTFTAHTLHL